VCSLASKCLNRERWDPAITVTNQSEEEDLASTAPGYGESGNLFAQKLSASSRLLQRSTIMYLNSVCDLGGAFKPVLRASPPMRETGPPSHSRHTAPTILNTIAALSGLVQDSQDVLDQIQDISTKLHDVDQLTPEEIEEARILRTSHFYGS